MTSLYDYMTENGIEDSDVYDATTGYGKAMGPGDESDIRVYEAVSDYILQHVELVGVDGPDLEGDFVSFADEHYDLLKGIIAEGKVAPGWAMDSGDRDEDLMRAVHVLIDYLNQDYQEFGAELIAAFGLLPEGYGVINDCFVPQSVIDEIKGLKYWGPWVDWPGVQRGD